MRFRNRQDRGFTLIELMIVISLILILVSTGRAKEISGIVWGLGVVFLLFFYVTTMI